MKTYPLKRVTDVLFSVLALAVVWPIMLVASVAIRLDSQGPVIFRQVRIGLHGIPFSILKFRTMKHRAREENQEGQAVLTNGLDPRVTRVGRFLRASSIDELPQLFNVLRGDMSLVGPRPVLKAQMAAVPDMRLDRFYVRPGLTGLAQVRGRRGLDWREQLEADSEYVQHCSFKLDLSILLRTVKVVTSRSGVYGSVGSNWRAYVDRDKGTRGSEGGAV